MNIGIDIDDTINNLSEKLYEYALRYSMENGIECKYQNEAANYKEILGWNELKKHDFYNKYLVRCIKEVSIKSDAKKYINKLKDEGNKIIIITARSKEDAEDIYDISKNWLIKKGIKIDKLEIGCKQKVDKCKENNIDIFIDDNVEHCNAVKENLGIPVILFNSLFNQEEKNLKRVYNWKEAYDEIEKYKT